MPLWMQELTLQTVTYNKAFLYSFGAAINQFGQPLETVIVDLGEDSQDSFIIFDEEEN